ncbi:hypothetical protein [Arenimonas composti]|uniref:TonB-dependent receptor plug domain-containing protein n=1 Tax=Arenimonas composti TR7-09 = DSM 18010 TaxID=1121013 RepID=A0A091BX28_9GAMM|nr:hypothetical protein [Arenimonas composti]KFN48885.1 hypothetical protein P873_13105 [Arenimonas composti TR7-09 = DSM 18010]
MSPLRSLTAAVLVALAASGAQVHAQAPAPLVIGQQQDDGETTALPIIRNNQVEAFLLIESGPSTDARSSLDRIIGRRNAAPSIGAGVAMPLNGGRRASASLALETNPTIGLLCNGSAVSRSFGALAEHCLVASLGPQNGPLSLAQPGARAEVALEGDRGALSATLGLNTFDVGPAPIPGDDGPSFSALGLALAGARIEQEDIGLLGEMKVGESGWVSIGGTLARARIVPANQLPGGVPPQWNTGTLTVGGGVGDFGGEIIGRVVEIPGSSVRYSNIGLGLTWRAPWRARLSVGAENVISNGPNPFVPRSDDDGSENRMPYIRYEQDL